MTKIKNSVALLLMSAIAFAGLVSTAYAHGTGGDHEAGVITLEGAEAHIELATEARDDAIVYVASLQELNEQDWRGSVPHLAHLARDLASAQAALADERYTDAADLSQLVINHSEEIMNGSILAENQMSLDDTAHTSQTSEETEAEVETEIIALQAQVKVLMQKLIQLLTLKLAAMQ